MHGQPNIKFGMKSAFNLLLPNQIPLPYQQTAPLLGTTCP
jgi:hypothetical protein